jgi:hypothetical protein
MTLIELAWLLFWTGGGALAGASLTSTFAPGYSVQGGFAGALLGFGAIFVISGAYRHQRRNPAPCRCGRGKWADFKPVFEPGWGVGYECACGLRYVMPKDWLWLEVRPEGEPRPYMKRDFWGRWVPAAEQSEANKAAAPNGGPGTRSGDSGVSDGPPSVS